LRAIQNIKNTRNSIKEAYIESIKVNNSDTSELFKKYKILKLSIHNVIRIHDDILFILNHPANENIRQWALDHLNKIAIWCKRNAGRYPDQLDNSGLPYTYAYSRFSYSICQWLRENRFTIALNNYDESSKDLNEVFINTLPPFLKDLCQMEWTSLQWFEYLKFNEEKQLIFLLDQFSKINGLPGFRDTLFEKLNLTIELYIDNPLRSRTFNSLDFTKSYYHTNWLKKINTNEWIKKSGIKEIQLSESQKSAIDFSSKLKLILLQRETEPVSYMDDRTIRFFELERGISIALFTMIPERQLPYESYVGYTLYKNGYAAAYGGAWIFGEHALIGLNIFEWCRGGESALFFNQLLRLYHKVFQIHHFEVEPYQYGLDNEEGIQTGAFWFYYRMGFIPSDKSLAFLAQKEFQKMNKKLSYKTGTRVLKKFTESNLILHVSKSKYLT
jgi:hypothetical protein